MVLCTWPSSDTMFSRTNWLDSGSSKQFIFQLLCHSLSSRPPNHTSSSAGGTINWSQHCTFNFSSSPQGKEIGYSLELSSMASSSKFNDSCFRASSLKSLILAKVIFFIIAKSTLKLINSFWVGYRGAITVKNNVRCKSELNLFINSGQKIL